MSRRPPHSDPGRRLRQQRDGFYVSDRLSACCRRLLDLACFLRTPALRVASIHQVMITSRTILNEALCQLGRGLVRACRWRHGSAVIAGGKRGLSPVIPAVLALLTLIGAVHDAEAAFPNGYSYRRLIDITNAQVSGGPHTNFPILVSTTLADLRTTGNGGKVTDAQGDDIIFTDSDGSTQLAHEIERYVPSTGELVAWVRVPSLAATSTLYIYYGNSAVTTFQGNVTSNGVTGVWDNSFKGVWHLIDNPTGALDQFSNSKTSANHGTSVNMESGDQVAAKANGGLSLDGTNEYIDVANANSGMNLGQNFTLEMWVKRNSLSSSEHTLLTKRYGAYYSFKLYFDNNNLRLYFDEGNGAGTWDNVTGGSITDTANFHYVGAYSDGTTIKVFRDGVIDAGSASLSGTIAYDTGKLLIGAAVWNNVLGSYLDGIIDEVRVSNVRRSDGWILTSYNSQNSPAGFYTMGAEESTATLSSAANQSFTVGQAAATASTLTVTDSTTPTITAAQDLRIRIPAGFNMTWDTTVTTFTAGGGAAGKVSSSGVTYEDSNRTAVINVTSNFAADDVLTIAGLKFANFTAASAASNLQLVVAGAGGATAATDDKTITINNPPPVAYRGAGAVASAPSGSINPGPGLPPGWQPGDIHIAAIEASSGTGSPPDVTMPAGWNLINQGNHPCGANNCRATLFWRLAQAGDTSPTITWTGGDTIIARIYGFYNVDPVNPLDTTPSFTSSGKDATVEAGAITTVTPNTMLVFIALLAEDSPTIGTPGTPVGSSPWSTLIYSEVAVSGGDDLALGMYYGLRSSTGVQPALVSTLSNPSNTEGSHGAQIALRPLSGGAGAPSTLSSAANQSFTVGQAAATASTLTVTDSTTPTITAAQELRIRIPAGFNMTWDTTVTTFTAGGGAAGKVSSSGVTYEDSNRTAVINVTSNFAADDVLTIAGLKFANFTAVSAANNLQLVVAGSGGATTATDDKTITINLAPSCVGAIASDSSSSATANSSVSSLTWSHTTSAGSNPVLLVSVAWRDNGSTISSVTYNSISLTKVGSTVASYNGFVLLELWQLVAPPAGTFNVVVTRSGSARMAAGAITLTGVDQTTPIEATNSATANSTTPSVSVTTVSNNAWVLDVLAFRREGNGAGDVPTGTPGAGQTERWSAYVDSGSVTSDPRNKGSTKGPITPAGAVTMSWALSGAVEWVHFAASIKPAGAGATLSSAVNQTFTVGQAAATASTLTVTDCATATITAAQDIRIRIPAALNMVWDTSVTTVSLGGGAAGKVSTSGVTYEDSNKTAVLNVTTNFAGSDQVTIAGLKFANFTATSSATSLQLVVAGSGGATAATDDKTITIAAATAASLSSAANQMFPVGQAATTASTLTVTDGSPALITAAQDLRIRIPAGFNMTWDTTVTTFTPGGGASGKVSATGVTYEDSNRTAVINVTTNFAAGDVLTVAGLKFANFTAVSAASNLQLVVAGAGGATAATDDKTITIVAATAASLSSAANQSFTVGQVATTASTLTVTDGSPTVITAAQDLRIRIPAGFNMTWDTTVTTFTAGGGAAGKVSATLLAYEDGNRTAVINVTSNFAASDVLTVAGLKFANFTAVSAASNLELVVAGAGGAAVATDDKTITVVAAGALSLSSAANQTFAVGQVSTAAIQMTVTDGPTPSITAGQDIRIRIPAGLNMIWDTSVTTVTLGGGAAGKVSATLLAYENSNKTAVINVTTNFAASDVLTVAGLKFTNFTAVSAASNLELVVVGAGGATAATDDKTIEIVSVVTLSSADNQTFTVGQASTTASTLTVVDSSTPTIKDAQELRIRIPATLSMLWDTSVTSITRGGTASTKVSSSVNYEDAGKTVRISVNTDFAGGDVLTIAGLKFTSFTAISAHNLQLVTAGAGGATAAIDDKTVTINSGGITNQQTIAGCVAPGSGTISLDLVTKGPSTTPASQASVIDVTHTISGSNRYVFVQVVSTNGFPASITSVVWDPTGVNQALSVVATRSLSTDVRNVVYGLVNPTAKTAIMRVTLSTTDSDGTFVAVSSFTGVDQTTPLGTPVTAASGSGSPTVTVSAATGDLVVDFMATKETSGNKTAGSGQTEIWDGVGPPDADGAGSTKPGAASVVMSWTGVTEEWATIGVPLKPAPGGPVTSLVLPSWTPQSGELLLVGVALRDETIVPSVSGNGLTWTQVADRDNDRGQMGVNLFRASGASPSAGSITISLPGNTLPAYAVAVRMSNVDTTTNQGVEAVATASGPAGADNDDMKVSVTTLTANATALAWGGQQGSATFSLPAGETMINQSSSDCGSSPDQIRGHMWQEVVPTPAATQLGQDNSLSSARPWAAIAVSIKPVPPTPPQAPGRFNAFEPTTIAGAMTGVIRTKIAGNSASLDVIALNSAKTAIDTAFTGTVRVEVLDASNNTGGLDANGCRSSWTVIQTLSNPTFVAGDNGRKTVSFTQANSYKDVRLRISYPTSSPTQIGCSGDNFAIRPSALTNFAVSDSDWQTAGTTRALTSTSFGTVVHKAGRPMQVQATAVNATGTAAATNYTGAPTSWLSACAGAACTSSFGTLTLATTFATGQLASTSASYSDVGSFALQLVDTTYASVDVNDTVGDCSASGSYVCSATINVGRFVPDNFTVSLNTPSFGSGCGAFTYVGQKFSYGTAPVVTLTARNSAGITTTRYAGNWWRITNATLTGKAYATASGTLDTSGAPGTDPVVAAAGSGTGTLTFSSGTGFLFPRTTPVAPFDAEISLAINVIDLDGVSYASNPARFGQASAGNGIAFSTGKPMRFGRFAIGNAYGSQLVPLAVRVEAQYWSGPPTNAFITNTLDNCTVVAPANYAMSNFTPNLSPSPTCKTAISGGGTLSSGRGALMLATPGAANDGSVLLTANLGATASGTTCTTLGGAPVSATTANLPHLRGNWTGGAYDQNPTARASFGVYRGAEEVIYMRENF